MPRLPLFVFGTLRRGECNHHYLAGRYDRVQPAVLPGYRRLDELMIVPEPGDEMDGELFWLEEAGYDATLAGCDELEQIPPGELVGRWYRRERVMVTTDVADCEAWAYTSARVFRA